MVSPSKKKKDRKGRENNGHHTGLLKEKTGSKRSKPLKPLSSKKFYLDLKNNTSLLKLETKLKSLGATIEQFLIKDVNYVVTDRKDTTLSESNSASCSTPASPSPSPSPSLGVSSPLDGLGQKKSKSRAEAMLEKVRLQPQCVKIDPLDNARSWNIPIYSLQEILLRLQKISSKEGKNGKRLPGLKILQGHYLKLETGRRPEFRQLREWPTLNLNCGSGENAFAPFQDGCQRVTQKAVKDGSERLAGGYCEMCCVDYLDIKTHVLTPQHLQFANNPDYYAQLDSLIKSKTINAFLTSQMCASLAGGPRRCLRSGSVESQTNSMGSRSSSMSHTNGHLLPRTRASTRSLDDSKPLEVQCNGVVIHNHLTRSAVKSDSVLGKDLGNEYSGILKRTRTISASCPGTTNEYSQLSPTGSDITHHLRSRKQMWLPTSLLGTTAEDALTNTRLRPSRDYPTPEAMKSPSQGKTSLKSPTTPFTDEPIEKKIKTNGKEDEDTSYSNSSSLNCSEVKKQNLQESSDEECIEINEKSLKTSKIKERSEFNKQVASSKRKWKKKAIPRELANLRDSNKRRKVQKKRLSVEEKLIEDNKSYYKVEVLNSKLRSTGYYITQSQRELEMSRTNGNDGCVTQNFTEPSKSEIKSEEKEPVVVRFKKVRQTELSLLSDEAESFMFGEPLRRESSVSTETSEDDDEVSLKLESESRERIVTKIKKEVLDESSMGSCSVSSSSTSLRRKRKSPDESILHDNAEYYKFESTGSRLRFHGNLFPPTPVTDSKQGIEEMSIKTELINEIKSESISTNPLKIKLDQSDFEPEHVISEDKSTNDKNVNFRHRYEDLEFSFESAPTHEPWYHTFQRQDACNEYYNPKYRNYPKILLPYEYPNSLIKKIKLAATKEKVRKRKRKDTKIQQLIVDDKPRKSPRCHASTLAIMSSLKRRKPRDSSDKKSETVNEQYFSQSEVVIQDEESRCSTIVDPPSVAPSDTQLSTAQTTTQGIPEIKIDSKPDISDIMKKSEADLKKAEEDIDKLFTDIICENEEDLIAHILQVIKKEVESSPIKESHKKGKGKVKSVKSDPQIELTEMTTCLPVDPDILDEELVGSIITPGPIMGMMNIIDGYRSCSSMERADYEHMNPHAVDALRVLIAESCNSSDCGGSSACDYSFLEDGKVCRKRKRKKRNMTGWPANNKKKFMKKGEELSTTVLRRNCKVKDGLESIKETRNVSESEAHGVIREQVSEPSVPLKEHSVSLSELQSQCNNESDSKESLLKLDSKKCSTISRTSSIDSSTASVEVQSCYIKVDKMPDNCVETFSRNLRSSDSNRSPNSRRSSRKAKVIGRQSLRRCR